MASLADLMVRVGVDDQLSSGIESAVDSVERNLGRIGVAGAAGGAALEGFARGQGDATAALGRASIASGETEESLRDLAHGMSDHTFAASDAADGMDLLAQKGITTREGFEEILPSVDSLADATGMELTDSIEAADKMLAPFGDDLNDVGDNSDQMARLISQTDVPLGTLERNLGRVPDELQGLGFGLDDAAAGIEHFRDQGYTGQEAVREFRRSVEDSGGDMDEFLDTLGLTADEWDEYGAAVEPATGLTDDLAEANNSVMTPMEKLQANVENLMFKYGGLAEAAGLLAMPLMALGPILKGIITVVPVLAKGIVGLVTGIGTAVTAIYTKVAALTAWAARMTATAARVVAGWVLMGAQSMAQAARMAAAWVLAMGPIGWIITAVVGLVALIIANWDKVKEWTVSAWEAVVDWVVNAWNNIKTWVADAVASTIDFVRAGWEKAKSWTQDAWDSVLDAVKSAWQWIKDAVSAGIDFIVGLFMNFTGPGLIIQHWDTIVEATSSAWNAVKDFISGVWNSIISWISNAVSNVLSFVQNGWNNVKSTTTSIWNSVVSWIKGIPGKILAGLAALGQLASTIGGYVTGAYNAATGKFNELVSWVGGLPGRILSGLGNLGSLLFQGGKNIIQGLIDGIKSMAGGVGDAISGAVDTVKDFLPWSPAKEGPLRDNPPELGGSNIVDMIAGGMADGESDVVAEAERIAAAAAIDVPDVSGPRVPGAARVDRADSDADGQGAGGTTISIDMRGAKLDSDKRVKQLSQDLNSRIQRSDRARGRTNLQGATR